MTSGRAVIYARISLDRESDEKGVARQERDCRELAEARGLDVVTVYADNDVGASTRSAKKPRPQYVQMLEDARAGLIDVILAYSNSRLTRRPLELEDLITLHERHGVKIATVVSGQDDLSTADGRMVARIKASVDAAEAERTAERLINKHLEMAREGVAVGHRAFGWNGDGSLHPTESVAARQVVADALAGLSMRAVAQQLNADGTFTTQGKSWSHQTVRQYLRNPRLCGWRTRHREVLLDASGKPVEGLWEPLVGVDTYLALCERLRAPQGPSGGSREGARRYMLSGLMRCGVCGATMFANRKSATQHTYRCMDNGHAMSISGVGADRVVGGLIVAALAGVTASRKDEAWPGEAELEEVERKVASTMAAFTEETLDASIAFPMLQQLQAKRQDMQKDRTRWLADAKGPVLERITPQRWTGMSVEAKRVAASRLLEAVLVKPSTQTKRFDPARMTPVWRRR